MSTAFNVWTVRPRGYEHSQVFEETAQSIHAGLTALGYNSVMSDEPEVEGRRTIVIGPNLLLHAGIRQLPKGTILYNLEQYANWGNSFLHDPDYVVWDFNEENSRRLGLKPTAILPIGYSACLQKVPYIREKTIDVLMVGSTSPRRKELFKRMRGTGLVVKLAFNVYGQERDLLIAQSRIQLNVHFSHGALMEQPRLMYLLANNCLVLSETSAWAPENEVWERGCVVDAYDALPWVACELVDSSVATRKELRERAQAFVTGRPIEKYLADALAKTL